MYVYYIYIMYISVYTYILYTSTSTSVMVYVHVHGVHRLCKIRKIPVSSTYCLLTCIGHLGGWMMG